MSTDHTIRVTKNRNLLNMYAGHCKVFVRYGCTRERELLAFGTRHAVESSWIHEVIEELNDCSG